MINKKITFVHIYYGTAGASGLYAKSILNSLNESQSHLFIVNYYYPDNDAKRWFFKYTEMAGPNNLKNFKILRFFVRYIELVYSLCRCLLLVVKIKPTALNYNLISQHYVEYIFLFILKKFLGVNIVLTLHDVRPFKSYYKEFFDVIKIKQKIINLAGDIILHNNSSNDDLRHYFIHNSRIHYHSFPLMSPFLSNSFDVKPKNKVHNNFSNTFLFVGHPRDEKGLDILCDAWINVQSKTSKSSRLIVACSIDRSNPILNKLTSNLNVLIIDKYLSDKEYFELINNSDCVILPYKRGTNSGIPGTIASMGTGVIASNIPMFLENLLIPKKSFFISEDIISLSDKIIDIIDNGVVEYVLSYDDLQNYKLRVSTEICETYSRLENIFSESMSDSSMNRNTF
jgi:glycosyltransferase involved in cell wall biosynthesis